MIILAYCKIKNILKESKYKFLNYIKRKFSNNYIIGSIIILNIVCN